MPKNFHVYKSSAGSGKTYTLVKEYLKLVLPDPGKVKHILAITFTNAAAAEMKERIINAIGEIAALQNTQNDRKGEKLLSEIISDWKNEKKSHIPDKHTLIINAGKALKQILHRYSDFSVSTIDSFVHRVIRTFAFDLRIPFQFEVELDTDMLLKQAVDLLINRAGSQQDITDLLVTYMMNQADDELDTRIEQKIAGMAKTLTDEESILYIQQIKDIPIQDFKALAKRLRQSARRFEQEVGREAGEALRLIREKSIPVSAFYRGKQGIVAYFYHLAEGNIREKIVPGSYVQSTFSEDKWVSAKCSANDRDLIMEIRQDITRHYENIQKLAAKKLSAYLVELALLKTIFPLALLSEVEKMLEQIKEENVILHISDFNKKIADIVSRQPVPFIYERLGERYKHYMIDEFQDTSLLQWQNLLPLVENGLSEGYMSLVVGDGKQAIYRFRNGDVEQFAALPKLTKGLHALSRPEWEVTLANNFEGKPLETNWRSTKAVVDFNNRFFTHTRRLLGEDVQKIYDDLQQNISPGKGEGYVEIRFAEGNGRQEIAEKTLNEVVDIIQHCSKTGHPLSDITVLCRFHNEASMVARELLGRNIPVISKESLLLDQSDEVNFMVAIIRLLANPNETIAAAEILSYLVKTGRIGDTASLHESLKESGLYRRNIDHGKNLCDGLESLLQRNGISFAFRDFAHLNLYDGCEAIVRMFFAHQTPPNPFVAFFMDAVYDFSAKHTPSFGDFISWWEENSRDYSIVVPKGVEAVQVMTVHKSKGLQFPVVIHPFASQTSDRLTRKGLWTDSAGSGIPEIPAQWFEMTKSSLEGTPFEADLREEMEKTFLDMLNATYVAFTRASKKLFIISKKEQKKYKPQSVNGMLHGFLQEQGLWKEDIDSYAFGQDVPPVKKDKAAGDLEPHIRQLLSNPWSRAVRMRSHQREHSVLSGQPDPLERGNLLHRAMENIHSPEDIEPVLDRLHATGDIDPERKNAWAGKIRKMMEHHSVAPYFVKGVSSKSEAGLFDENGAFYRPDRVVFLEDQCAIIDYKTGKTYAKHEDQMNAYAGILQKMGYARIQKIVLYLDEAEVKIF
ncbi:MAG: hypothetical protein EA394_00340 [Bacteroidia bacterium]|nr:MAG: hypothetical protein EA394_00340 [Bacteroidia bacterium]